MLLIGLVIGLVGGLLLGGRLDHLANARLRWVWAIFAALLLRFGTEYGIRSGVPLVDALRVPLFALAFGLLAFALWLNRDRPGLLVAALGVAANGFAFTVNGGRMPVWEPALGFAHLNDAELDPAIHAVLPQQLGLEFLLRAGPFGDILPVPLPFVPNVASVGDVFLSTGIGLFVFGTLLYGEAPSARTLSARFGRSSRKGMIRVPPDAAGVDIEEPEPTVGLDGPVLLGGTRASTALTVSAGDAPIALPAGTSDPSAVVPTVGRSASPSPVGTVPSPTSTASDRARTLVAPSSATAKQHPFVRLALDARFSSFWLGQTISLFGDRLHQVALGVLVYGLTGSPLLTGLVFLAATLPNLLLGPIAGTFVDRWDQKHVMVAADLLRAVLVLALPAAAATNIVLVYLIVFAVTTVSIFFRPAKAAVVPRIVAPEDLIAANSATWTSETLADIAGYPLAGLFVAFLGAALPIAFWVDAASYLVSALLIAGLAIPPVARETAPRVAGAVRAFLGELADGWRFLRSQPPLFQNTLVSTFGQMSLGSTLALTVVYAREWLDPAVIPYPQNYAAIETAIGLGNLVGGVAVGAVGAKLRKGRLVVAGFVVMGFATIFLGLTDNVLVALAAAAIVGVANLVYVIPSQTLFAELTPIPLIGRVVSFRSSLVFGAMTGAMAISGVLAEAVPVGLVIAGFGVLTAASGLVAALLPSVRNA